MDIIVGDKRHEHFSTIEKMKAGMIYGVDLYCGGR